MNHSPSKALSKSHLAKRKFRELIENGDNLNPEELYELMLEAGCDLPPANSYTSSMIAAVAHGVNGNKVMYDEILNVIQPSFISRSATQKARQKWVRDCVKILKLVV